MFRHLNELKAGDHFYLDVLDETLAYEVETIQVVLPSETSWLTMDENENQVTLLTCDPYMINTHRMLVTGRQIPYVPDEVAADEKPGKHLIASYLPWISAGIAITLVLLFVARKRRKLKRTDAS